MIGKTRVIIWSCFEDYDNGLDGVTVNIDDDCVDDLKEILIDNGATVAISRISDKEN